MEALVAREAHLSFPFVSRRSVVDADNELYTHFIPRLPDFSRSQSTENGLVKPNRTLHDPYGTGS